MDETILRRELHNELSKREILGENTNDAEVDRSVIKIIILAVAGMIFSGLFGFFLNSFLSFGNFNRFVLSISFAAAFLIIILLQTLFIKDIWKANLIITAESFSLLIGFYNKISANFIVGAAIVAIILIISNLSGKKSLDNMVKINFWKISKIVLPKGITALALFVALSYTANINNGFFLSKPFFENLLNFNLKIVRQFYPDFNFASTTEELTLAAAKNQIYSSSQFQILPDQTKKQLVNQASNSMESTVRQYLGQNFDFKAKFSEAVYESIRDKFDQLPQDKRNFVLFGVGFLVFLTIISFTFPVRIIISIIAFFIYEVLLSANFATIVFEGKSREIIILK